MGPLPKRYNSNKYIIVAIDEFISRSKQLKYDCLLLSDCIVNLKNIILIHRYTKKILHDFGKNLTPQTIAYIIKLIGAVTHFIVIYFP